MNLGLRSKLWSIPLPLSYWSSGIGTKVDTTQFQLDLWFRLYSVGFLLQGMIPIKVLLLSSTELVVTAMPCTCRQNLARSRPVIDISPSGEKPYMPCMPSLRLSIKERINYRVDANGN